MARSAEWEPRKATSLYTLDTELSADSIASHPARRGLFALGTYQVDKHEMREALGGSGDDAEEDEEGPAQAGPGYERRGRLSLFQAGEVSDGKLDCQRLYDLDTPAILDMCWTSFALPGRGPLGTLAVGTAVSTVTLHALIKVDEGGLALAPPKTLTLNRRKALCLSLDSTDRKPGPPDAGAGGDTSLIVSQSDGSLAYIPSLERACGAVIAAKPAGPDSQPVRGEGSDEDEDEDDIAAHAVLNTTTDLPGLETWKAHGHEAWIAAWDCWSDGSVAWSGGDDLKLKGWDLRTPNGRTGRKPTFTCQRGFDGGVTTLQSHHLRQHLWAVGSYDAKLRLFDARQPLRPLTTLDVGGGIWRVKWHPEDADILLVGCMHDGFKVVSAPQGGEDMCIVSRFDEHKSLAYGCDWDRGKERGQERSSGRVFSCSFYDARLHAWQGIDGA